MVLDDLSAPHDPDWFVEAGSRARNGITLLNERGSNVWVTKVNIVALDMGHGSRDILGQIYGSYNRGMAALFGDDWDIRSDDNDPKTGRPYVAFGFAVSPLLPQITKFMLTDAWKKALWTS
jgi:hypothetical protein